MYDFLKNWYKSMNRLKMQPFSYQLKYNKEHQVIGYHVLDNMYRVVLTHVNSKNINITYKYLGNRCISSIAFDDIDRVLYSKTEGSTTYYFYPDDNSLVFNVSVSVEPDDNEVEHAIIRYYPDNFDILREGAFYNAQYQEGIQYEITYD